MQARGARFYIRNEPQHVAPLRPITAGFFSRRRATGGATGSAYPETRSVATPLAGRLIAELFGRK